METMHPEVLHITLDTLQKKEVCAQRNVPVKYYISYIRKPTYLLSFYILCNFIFSLMNALAYVDLVDIDLGIHKGKK